MPKGYKTRKTLDKEAAREALRALVIAELRPLVAAQLENAKGIRYLVVRSKKGGKFLRVTESMAKAKLGSEEEIVEVWEKDPCVQAFSDLMNRALDKPAEHVNVNLPQVAAILEELENGRKRAASRDG